MTQRRSGHSASQSRYLAFINAEVSTPAVRREFASLRQSALRSRLAAAFSYLQRLAKLVRRG
jgi:hypothetical protein